jgi:hypothetical protein
MAQHIPISEKILKGQKDEGAKSLRKIIKQIRNDLRECRETGDLAVFESKYQRLPDDFLEKGETEAVITHVDVPESLVWGGRASVEIHFRMSVINSMFLVA